MEDEVQFDPQHAGRLARIEGIIWDLDNTLYRLDEALQDAFNLSIARAAIAAGTPLRLGEAAKLARESFFEHGYSGQVFIEKYDIDQRNLHFDFHGYLDETVIERSREMRTLFTQLALDHVLLTHSARPWALKVLTHLNLQDWFPPARVLALEDCDFEHKHLSAMPFERAVSRLALPAEKILVVEDTLRNLEIPHRMGLMTCFIHHGKRPESLPAYAHIAANSTLGLMETVLNLQRERRREKNRKS